MQISQGSSPKIAIKRMLIVNVVIPYLIYRLLESHVSSVAALSIAAAVPLLETIYGFIKTRKLDAFSLFIFSSLILGVLATLMTGDERFILLKESYAIGIMGLALLVSLLFPKPLLYVFAKRTLNDPQMTYKYETNPAVRATFRKLTLVWAVVLLFEVSVKICLVFLLTTDRMLVIAPIASIIIIGIGVLWTFRYVKSRKNPVQ
ncbi:VC0807 family protein [Paenibacillus qinlingensis]|uniref:Intracellular septation protein A n=1 Tax=Paenibacillus qinlingensis TaxID=1837343 RepID=A0ABU1NS47_9BACL|nr:VC0807 family protein [Paenibacillus qinlingensis]MDR6550274.1 intracellular septation protein A [Paenibacillus qinlingensis]